MKKGLLLTLLCIVFAVASARSEEVYDQKEWVWGCQIRGRALDGTCVMRPFTKVGEADNDVDTDEARTLGFEPGNVPITRDGQPIYSRISSVLFLKPGEIRLYSAAKCSCGK